MLLLGKTTQSLFRHEQQQQTTQIENKVLDHVSALDRNYIAFSFINKKSAGVPKPFDGLERHHCIDFLLKSMQFLSDPVCLLCVSFPNGL